MDEPHSRNITIEPKPQAENDPRHPLTPTANLPSDQHIVSCSLQLYVNEGSEAISPCTLEHQPGPLLANQRLLYEGMYPVQVGDDGRCLIGFFQASRPIYKVFAETSSVRSPDGPESEEPNFINHISARLLMPDSNRREMPDLAPELLEAIFLLSVERYVSQLRCSYSKLIRSNTHSQDVRLAWMQDPHQTKPQPARTSQQHMAGRSSQTPQDARGDQQATHRYLQHHRRKTFSRTATCPAKRQGSSTVFLSQLHLRRPCRLQIRRRQPHHCPLWL